MYSSVVFILGGTQPKDLLNKIGSGILIHQKWVLTAAHLIRSPNPPRWISGWDSNTDGCPAIIQIHQVHYFNQSTQPEPIKFPEDVKNPVYNLPVYTGKDTEDDFVLLELTKDFPRGYDPTLVLRNYYPDENESVVVTGVGASEYAHSQARFAVLAMNRSENSRLYGRTRPPETKCAGFPGGKDSGGGWFVPSTITTPPLLIGITQGIRLRPGYAQDNLTECPDADIALEAAALHIGETVATWIENKTGIVVQEVNPAQFAPTSSGNASSPQTKRPIFTLLGLSRPELRFYELCEDLAAQYCRLEFRIAGPQARNNKFWEGDLIQIELTPDCWTTGKLVIKDGSSPTKDVRECIDIQIYKHKSGKHLWWQGDRDGHKYVVFLRTDGTASDKPVKRILVQYYDNEYCDLQPSCLDYLELDESDRTIDPALEAIPIGLVIKKIDRTPLQDDEGDGYHPPVQP